MTQGVDNISIGAGANPANHASEEDYSALNPLSINPEDYKSIWADYEMSEAQYNELLGVVWEIAHSFVLMGWNADISQILFASALQNAGSDSDKLLTNTYTKATTSGPNNGTEKVSDNETS